MLPSPSELRYFLEIAGTLNLSRAAERLGISQPTLSLAVQRLERSFGSPLLIRGKSGVQLTHGGRRLASRARQLVEEWDKVRGDVLESQGTPSGRYVIGCHPSVAMYRLPDFLPALLSANPALEIKLVHDLSRRITEDVISFKVDFGIVVNPARHPDLVVKLLCRDVVSLWVGPGRSQQQNTLICDPELLQTQSILKQLGRAGLSFARVLPSSNLDVITALVAAGAGVGVLPERVARRIPAQGLKPFSKTAPRFEDEVCLVYRADAQRSAGSRAIAEAICG
jgi:DNA-binding transcriptional LysR family regulator